MCARLFALSLFSALPPSADALRTGVPEAPGGAGPRDWPEDYWGDDLRFPSWSSYAGGLDPKDNSDEGGWSSRVLVFPKQKLAFCYIEKNACTQFNLLFNHLNHKDGVWWMSQPARFELQLSDLDRSKGWKWAVFLRNPLLRYLSAWGSKCWQKEDGGTNCVPRDRLSPNAAVPDFEAQVAANKRSPGPMAHNPHWALQQAFCGGLHNVSHYDFVGHLHGDVNAQVHRMLAMVGAQEDYVNYLFPPHNVSGHHTLLDPEKYYRQHATRDAVKHMYEDDYHLPGL